MSPKPANSQSEACGLAVRQDGQNYGDSNVPLIRSNVFFENTMRNVPFGEKNFSSVKKNFSSDGNIFSSDGMKNAIAWIVDSGRISGNGTNKKKIERKIISAFERKKTYCGFTWILY